MRYFIKALDTSGRVTLRRESVPAAVKKASELISDGCWNVEIETPGGVVYRPPEFERLRARVRGLFYLVRQTQTQLRYLRPTHDQLRRHYLLQGEN